VSVLVLSDYYGAESLAGLDVVHEPREDVEAVLCMPPAPVGAQLMDELPRLKLIATASIGFDYIDVDAARERSVWVANVPDYCIDEVADHTLALLLASTRSVVAFDRDVRAGRWDARTFGWLHTLRGLRVGIVGHGRIGSAVAERLRAFGAELLVHDVRDVGVPLVPLDELLARSDAVTLHVPLNASTRGLIGTTQIAGMRSGAFLVNTSRGAVVELEPLLRALREGHLAGAALDVLPEEPPRELPDLPNLIVTPHAAYQSREAERKAVAGALDAVRAALRGERPAHDVTAAG
jgi:D-3-phosphoglycerate dehydrogenase / 2-oxoglutarate reductase